MTDSEMIVCKPTPWFLLRAAVMLLMFGVFAGLFFVDGSTGYRKKNETFYLNKAFQQANEEFAKMNASNTLTADEWERHAAARSVKFPEDPTILPATLRRPMPWPLILHDFERMKPLQWNILWREYTKERGMNSAPPEEPYDAQKIKEQWVVGTVCAVLAAAAGIILVRTLGRSMSADGEAVVSQQGKRVPYADFKTLDLRKWDTKGLAFLDYDGASGKGRIRLDGLTYGGFKKEAGEPAEQLMRRIRSRFSGEIIEYAAVPRSEPGDPGSTPA